MPLPSLCTCRDAATTDPACAKSPDHFLMAQAVEESGQTLSLSPGVCRFLAFRLIQSMFENSDAAAFVILA
jgi:hypothetical protein